MGSGLGQKVYLFKYDYFKYDHDIIKIFEQFPDQGWDPTQAHWSGSAES